MPGEIAMTITVKAYTEGGLTEYQLPGPGGEMRFTVGEPDGARSALWKLWGNDKTSDVYLLVRSLGRFTKVSLHQSGDWRLQWTTPEVAQERGSRGPNRILRQWPRPAAMEGWTAALSICVPGDDVVPFIGKPAPTDVIWAPKPESGQILVFRVLLVEPSHIAAQFDEGGFFFRGFELPNGEACLLVGHLLDSTAELDQWLAQQRSGVGENETYSLSDTAETNPRSLVLSEDDVGNPVFWDLARPIRK